MVTPIKTIPLLIIPAIWRIFAVRLKAMLYDTADLL